MHARPLACLLIATLAGCDSGPLLSPEDVGVPPVDTGAVDAPLDGGRDGRDAGLDAADTGPPCETLTPTEPTDPTAGRWSEGFGHPGVGGDLASVGAIAFGGDDVFVGGRFESAGALEASNVAAWNATNGWRALGAGLPTGVGSLAVLSDGSVIAAHEGTVGVSTDLSRWDGTRWSAFAQVDGVVSDLQVVGTLLFAVGDFTQVGGVAAEDVAYHDGTTWHGYAGLSPDAPVSALSATSATDVCIGGTFTNLGVVSARGVACFDGSAWIARSLPLTTPDTGIDAGVLTPNAWWVSDLERTSEGSLLVAGSFLLSATDAGGGIARWTGSAWVGVGGGTMRFAPGESGAISSIAVVGEAIYVGGAIEAVNVDRAPPTEVHAAARWDGTLWNGMGGLYREGGIGFGGGVGTVAAGPDGSVYYAGQLTRADSLAIGNVVRWDGVYWQGLRTPTERYWGVGNAVAALETVGTCATYVGGDFRYAGGVLANGIARFDRETGYSALGDGMIGGVDAIAVDDEGNVYAGGNFVDASGAALSNLALWNGVSWDGLDGGTNGPVTALALSPDGNTLYVGGLFTQVGGVRASYVASYDGTAFADLGRGMMGYPYPFNPDERSSPIVSALLVDPATGDLIVAGSFLSVGEDELEVHNVARWDGTAWHAYGAGLGNASESVLTLALFEGRLVAGGSFVDSGGAELARYAVWTGTAWETLGAQPPAGSPVDMVASENFLYVVGSFFDEGVPRHAAVYDGTTWSYLGEGLSDATQAVTLIEGGLLVGGVFDRAGTLGSEGIAFWEFTP